MDVAAIEHEVGGHLRGTGLGVAVQQNHVVRQRGRAGDLDADEAVVMRRRRRGDGRGRVAGDQLRHEPGLGRRDARARRRQTGMSGRADVDPARAALVRQHEVPDERAAGLELDDVAGLRGIERGLEVAAGRHRDQVARRHCRWSVGRVEKDAWQCLRRRHRHEQQERTECKDTLRSNGHGHGSPFRPACRGEEVVRGRHPPAGRIECAAVIMPLIME